MLLQSYKNFNKNDHILPKILTVYQIIPIFK